MNPIRIRKSKKDDLKKAAAFFSIQMIKLKNKIIAASSKYKEAFIKSPNPFSWSESCCERKY